MVKPTKYHLNNGLYLIVKEGHNTQSVVFEEKSISSLTTQKVKFLGLGDTLFATLLIDPSKKQIILDVSQTDPHSYFDESYAQVTLKSSDGLDILFSKKIPGINATISKDIVPLSVGNIIELHHEEPSRLILKSGVLDFINHDDKKNVLEVTLHGLKNNNVDSQNI